MTGSVDLTWRDRLDSDDQAAVRALVEAAAAVDGIAPVGDQVLRALAHDRTQHLLALDSQGSGIVGYADLAPAGDGDPAMAELVVHPDARRRGIGAQLAREALAAAGDGTRIWAHGNLPAARALAASLGLTVARQLLQMSRSLADLPPVPEVAGARIATYAGPQDDAELLRVNNAAFSWHPEQGGWTDTDIAERRDEAWFDPAGLFLALDTESGALLGFHWTKIHRLASGEEVHRSASGEEVHSAALGEVYVVGVDPDAQGRGLGNAVTLIGLHHLADRLGGGAAVMLYVEADNTAAVKTYRRLGFATVNTDVAYA